MIVLTGCLQSRFCRRLVEERDDDARAHLDDLIQAFGPEQVYFEVQKNGIPEQDKANEGIVRLARELGRPLVATADVHYLRREDFDNHAALLCVQTKSTLQMPKMSFDTNEFYIKSSEEMAESFAEWPEAVPTTLEIAERCEIEIELGKLLLPQYPTENDEEPEAMLRRIAAEGLRARYGDPPPAEAVERLEFELGVIEEMGFSSYFLIVWDFVRYAKENGVAVGPGRGSAAGSIVSYSLNITDLDPLANDLLFERFLNPGRKSMPDIDIDFSVRGRERMIRYVGEKYGRESVAQIITFGKMAPRAATRDAARVLGFDYATGDRLAKQIPEPIMGRNPSFEECLAPGQELRKTYDSEPDAKKVLDVAQGLEGIIRNNSIHAAAVVIADRPLQEIVPLQLAEDKSAPAATNGSGKPERQYKIVTQYSMNPIEEMGLLKMDFLGLRNLDVIEDAIEIIERSRGEKIDMESIPIDDAKTYEMLARGDSTGVFQLESEGMREAMKKVRPTEFDDIVALVSLYRPGAMAYIPAYAKGKRNPAIGHLPRRAPALLHGVDLRLRPLPGAVDGDRQADGRLQPGRGGRPAQGDRQEEARPDGDDEGQIPRRSGQVRNRSQGRQGALEAERSGGGLLLQQVPRRLLRADLLPHRLPQGQLPGRVHGGGDLLGDEHQRQGPLLRQPLLGDGHRRPPARRQLLRSQLRRLRERDPVRPRRGQERRPCGGGGDPPRPRGKADRVDLGLLRAGRLPGGEQTGDRMPDQVRRPRLHRRQPQRDAGNAAASAIGGREGAGRRAARSGLDLRLR